MIAAPIVHAAFKRGRSDRDKGITTNPYHKPSQPALYEAWARGNGLVEVRIRPYDPNIAESIATVGGANLEKLTMALKRNFSSRYVR